jgi:hypothetical protein
MQEIVSRLLSQTVRAVAEESEQAEVVPTTESG